jgi:YHS domain-containing protein
LSPQLDACHGTYRGKTYCFGNEAAKTKSKNLAKAEKYYNKHQG